MKELKHLTRYLAVIGGIFWAALVLTGCQSGPVFADFTETGATAGTSDGKGVVAPTPYSRPKQNQSDILFIGDVITINFNSGETQPLPAHSEAIKDDGRITPPYVGSIVAKGKSPGELQDELQKLYNVFYKNMTVTVSSKERYYTVLGEVKAASPKPYLGTTTILDAISAAGDFTEFAKKTQIRINHPNGKTETIDYFKAIEDPKQNVPIYPGDTIIVPRRLF